MKAGAHDFFDAGGLRTLNFVCFQENASLSSRYGLIKLWFSTTWLRQRKKYDNIDSTLNITVFLGDFSDVKRQ
jgi:hypothetical protein